MTAAGAPPAGPARRGFLVEAIVFGAVLLAALAIYLLFVRERRPPNVILVSIDTLRADHVGCYGYGPRTTPHLDRLAAEGVRFERVHSTTSWTLPAHVALMTGLPNQVHGVVHDQVALHEKTPVLAATLRAAGYATGGFFGGPYLDPVFGFGRGFDLYENCGVDMYAGLDGLPAEERARLLALKERKSHQVITAPALHEKAEAFLERHRDEPFFLFLHHWDVHYDFNAPPEFVRKFAGATPPPLDVSRFPMNDAITADMPPAAYQYLVASYDAEIHWVDHHVGRLLRKLEELGLADDTYVVVTSDHGEEFFEHGRKGHRQNLHEETLRIPLIVRGPGLRPGVVVAEPARIFDVMPTILDLCDVAPERAVIGQSLVPLMEGDAAGALRDLPLVAELTDVPRVPAGGDVVPADFCVRHDATGRGGYKLMHVVKRRFETGAGVPDFDGPMLEEPLLRAYHLNADPEERHDLVAQATPLLPELLAFRERLLTGLAEVRRALELPNSFTAIPDELNRLIQAGYLTGGKLEPVRPADRPSKDD